MKLVSQKIVFSRVQIHSNVEIVVASFWIAISFCLVSNQQLTKKHWPVSWPSSYWTAKTAASIYFPFLIAKFLTNNWEYNNTDQYSPVQFLNRYRLINPLVSENLGQPKPVSSDQLLFLKIFPLGYGRINIENSSRHASRTHHSAGMLSWSRCPNKFRGEAGEGTLPEKFAGEVSITRYYFAKTIAKK